MKRTGLAILLVIFAAAGSFFGAAVAETRTVRVHAAQAVEACGAGRVAHVDRTGYRCFTAAS